MNHVYQEESVTFVSNIKAGSYSDINFTEEEINILEEIEKQINE